MEDNLQKYLKTSFKNGLSYDDAAQLCLRLYCTVDGLPDLYKPECNINSLSEIFSNLAASGYITGNTSSAATYGANFHEVTDKGHWIEIITSIFKKGYQRNVTQGEALMSALGR